MNSVAGGKDLTNFPHPTLVCSGPDCLTLLQGHQVKRMNPALLAEVPSPSLGVNSTLSTMLGGVVWADSMIYVAQNSRLPHISYDNYRQ